MEQLSFDFYNNTNTNRVNKDDLFGCCSHYRECSDAKKCLIADRDYSKSCIYRDNLENGKIFYGKNANGFDMNTYNSFVDKYNHLEAEPLYLLKYIIFHFNKYSSDILFYADNSIEVLQEQGFIVGYISKKAILNLCKSSFLMKFLSTETKNELNKMVQKREGDPKARAKKNDVVNWLMENSLPEVEEYVNKFVFVYISDDMRKYIFELYYDFLINDTKENYKLELPKYNEPNFIKNK